MKNGMKYCEEKCVKYNEAKIPEGNQSWRNENW